MSYVCAAGAAGAAGVPLVAAGAVGVGVAGVESVAGGTLTQNLKRKRTLPRRFREVAAMQNGLAADARRNAVGNDCREADVANHSSVNDAHGGKDHGIKDHGLNFTDGVK